MPFVKSAFSWISALLVAAVIVAGYATWHIEAEDSPGSAPCSALQGLALMATLARNVGVPIDTIRSVVASTVRTENQPGFLVLFFLVYHADISIFNIYQVSGNMCRSSDGWRERLGDSSKAN